MKREQVSAWVERYVQPWRSNAPGDIERLFAADATYATGPFDEPWRGREAIVAGWLARKDEPGTWTFRSEVLATTPEGGVVRGWTTYPADQQEFSNIWLIALDDDGQCSAFTEWWVERPAAAGAPAEGVADATAAG
jgi:hypothetical protein